MTASIPQTEPTEITAGDYIQWNVQGGDYPAPTWDVSYVLINADNKYTIDAADNGSDHLITIDGATSANFVAGVYNYQRYATNGSQRVTTGTGEITIKPNFASVSTIDNRTQTKRILDAINAVIEKRASTDQESYQIAGRALKRTPLPDLIKLRDRYQAMYAAEQRAEKIKNGIPASNKIFVRL